MNAPENAVVAGTPNAVAVLSEYDFVVCVDASGSMGDYVKAGSQRTRWEAVQESAMTFVRDVEKLDSDGLGLVIFSGAGITVQDGVTSANIRDVFAKREPRGGTPLAEALQSALTLAGKSDKKDFIVVFTDGVPDDKAAAAETIRAASQCLSKDDELTFLFVQVGNDAGATLYLKSLDDDLKGAKFDIVDAKTVEEVDRFATTTDLILAAISG